ncbi:hypothetical protein [Asanoa iriomotensis]|uniref:Universal stress protein family protein n=1 Tax=Asanoa iriomotensis TaxID=234613 RepID=A0ABQ4BXN3_9ACTN|nr:hypothetical protein [Asanoa iriomotensis]GIF55289.1 hypothetical protein Air01nite_13840 [Asanoa iriomotensis]
MTSVHIGLDRGDATVAAAEHWLHELLADIDPTDVMACTHFVSTPTPHVAVSLALPRALTLPDPAAEFAEGARIARDAHAAGTAGRAVVFPGQDRMTGVMSVADLLAAGAIDRIRVLGSAAPPAPSTEVDTLGYLRPQWMDGRLTLLTQPANSGRLAPFEVADQRGCCSDH